MCSSCYCVIFSRQNGHILRTPHFAKFNSFQVLPDGTIVKVNRTIISDTSDDGNSYFFHSTSFHNFDKPEENASKGEVDEVTEKPEEKFEEFPIVEYEEIPFLDDSLNEVPEDNVGIDGGLA